MSMRGFAVLASAMFKSEPGVNTDVNHGGHETVGP
jgi:hypothetical protein